MELTFVISFTTDDSFLVVGITSRVQRMPTIALQVLKTRVAWDKMKQLLVSNSCHFHPVILMMPHGSRITDLGAFCGSSRHFVEHSLKMGPGNVFLLCSKDGDK